MMSKRTKKVFVDYNEYQDRPFGLKWGTAFALDELMKVVVKNQYEATKVIVELPQMSRNEIDKVLQIALLKSKHVAVQLNHRDDFGTLLESIHGSFMGYADEQYLYLDDLEISWENIRNISIIETQ